MAEHTRKYTPLKGFRHLEKGPRRTKRGPPEDHVWITRHTINLGEFERHFPKQQAVIEYTETQLALRPMDSKEHGYKVMRVSDRVYIVKPKRFASEITDKEGEFRARWDSELQALIVNI